MKHIHSYRTLKTIKTYGKYKDNAYSITCSTEKQGIRRILQGVV